VVQLKHLLDRQAMDIAHARLAAQRDGLAGLAVAPAAAVSAGTFISSRAVARLLERLRCTRVTRADGGDGDVFEVSAERMRGCVSS
jgi:hypothetical protein